jgi:hypothetical protein
MRDNMGQKCIASYYIKTVLLHIVDHKDLSFWTNPLSQVFMTVLKEYREFIKDQKIPYYWNKKNNLIGKVGSDTLANVSNRIGVVIKDIENNPDKPETVAKYLLSRDEYRILAGGVVTEASTQSSNQSCVVA